MSAPERWQAWICKVALQKKSWQAAVETNNARRQP
jgi:hypothetical protein